VACGKIPLHYFRANSFTLLECRAPSVTIASVRRFLKLFAIAVLFSAMLPLPASNGMTDEEKKQEFLKAREEMQTVEEPAPAASATPKPKPKPAQHHKATPTPTPAQHRKHTESEHPQPTPEPEPESTPVPQEHRKPTPSPRPTQALITWPSATPKPTPPPRATPEPTPAPTPASTPAEHSSHQVQVSPKAQVYVQNTKTTRFPSRHPHRNRTAGGHGRLPRITVSSAAR
jgi:hypothetical protein